ncbi:L-cysteine desulfidase family protein [Anaerotignum sp.]|nr:L-serine ammonia-lyase, iron-sulfur-dependent, subunit alpha [Anaerotignum sp.]MBQ7759044.1 serine dehydratase subunit alpha family protein [Anaerotignum sp.]
MDMNVVINAIKAEMKPSMGCTEPVAIALAVSRTCEMLANPAEKLDMVISSNIFKNAYSVQIPNTGTCGIELACVLGSLLAKPGNTMEICADIKPEHVTKAQELVKAGMVTVKVLKSSGFYIECTATSGSETAHTITEDAHDNMVFAEKDGKVLVDDRKTEEVAEVKEEGGFDVTQHTFKEFYDWANEVDVADLQFIKEAIDMNMEIAKIGMEKKYCFGVGPTIQNLISKGMMSNDVVNAVRSIPAAAADFRMWGGSGSVMTFCGSGNQGISTTLPMAVFADKMGIPEEKLLRAEFMAMLMIMYMKKHVGRLSPVCGAMVAGTGSAAGMTYMLGGTYEQIDGAVQNMMGSVAGIFCDGAKGGCAVKVAACAGEAVYAAMYSMDGSFIPVTDGINSTKAEDTAKNLAKLSHEALDGVDMKVIEIMQEKK